MTISKEKSMSNNKKIRYVLMSIFLLLCVSTALHSVSYAQTNGQVAKMTFYDESYFRRYNKTITLNFQKIQVRSLLQLMAQSVGGNIVVSDDVQGTMSIHVTRVPWYEAFKVILVTQNLGVRQFGQVWEIAKKETLIRSELQDLEFSNRLSVLTPIESAVITLHYANAQKIADMIDKTLYVGRGVRISRVHYNERTNSIWVRDTKYNINQVRALVKKLDVPVKQIGIEAKVLSVNVDDAQDIGAQFGITSKSTGISGSLSGSESVRDGGIPSIVDRLGFNAPVASTVTRPAASIALAKFDITNKTFLDLQLSLLTEEGLVKVISNPQLLTTDNNSAKILSGEEIPYQESTSSGATNIAFKEAVLSLDVLPQVTKGNEVILNIKINEDKRGDASFNGEPAIDTREIKTAVLMRSGDTVVIGGIYKDSHTLKVHRVPFFSDLPILGRFFRRESKSVSREELVILLTPHFDYKHTRNRGPKNKNFKLKMDLPYYKADIA